MQTMFRNHCESTI